MTCPRHARYGITKGDEPMSDSRPYIECGDLFKIYKRADIEVVALRGLDLKIGQGELMAIVGASGSGKTTLLNILSGLDRPSAGQVRVGDRDLLDISDRELVEYRRSEVGFVWQSTGRNLLPYLTAKENVALPMAIASIGAKARNERAGELLATLGLGNHMDRLPEQMSGGEQQRVAIAVALANNPPLLLADEPTGELDTHSSIDMFERLRDMAYKLGVTVVVVTHYAGVAQFVDRVAHIRDGRIDSEVLMKELADASGERKAEEYVVVDRAGRLQLPQEFVEKLHLEGLVKVDMSSGRVYISPSHDEESK